MGVSKVVYNTENGEEVLVDLTSDSVTPETLAEGETAHGANGNLIIGTAKKVNVVQSTGSSTTDIMSQAAVTEEIDNLSKEIANLVITPQMYGAVGDGVHDDTEYFEQALAEHNHVFVPSGEYRITRPLNLAYKKSLFSEDGQNATIIYDGDKSTSIILVGRMTVFRNINIVIKNLFEGTVFDTHNFNMTSDSNGKHSKIEHVRVKFSVESPKAVLIGITVDSGTDANNIPLNTGNCYQTFRDIVVDGSAYYGTGIKMTLVQGRTFTEATKTGFPWITHIVYDDIYLANPYTAIKAGVENTSGSEYFERIAMGHILFNNVTTQNQGIENTRYFFDVDHFSGYFSKCIGWDYHHTTNDYGEKVNIIGEGVNLSFSNCEMNFGQELLECCDFIAETDSGLTVEDNPEYFMNKYFRGSFLSGGYDSVDAKIDAKLHGEYVANIAEEKVNEILYSGFTNVLEDPLTQIKLSSRFSNSSNQWVASNDNTTVIIPIVTGGNIIRWSPWAEATLENFQLNKYALSSGYQSVFFFNDDELTEGVVINGNWENLWVDDENGGYLQISNPNGYKYVSLPFFAYQDISAETMVMTINSEITNDEGQSFAEYLKDNVIYPAVEKEVNEYAQPKGNYLTEQNLAYGICDTVAGTAEKVVTVEDENWKLKVGSVVMVYFSVSNNASNVKLNVNNTGAYPIWYNDAEYTSTGTAYTGYAKRVTTYMFNGTHWVWIANSYDSNTTYKNVALGHGYATCTTAEATTAKVGTLASYALTVGGIVAVKFTNAVPANATLNINSKGAKNIFYRGAKIVANVIKAGDIATFIYDGTQYQLLSVDRWQEDIKTLTSNTETWTFTLADGSTVTKKVVLA